MNTTEVVVNHTPVFSQARAQLDVVGVASNYYNS